MALTPYDGMIWNIPYGEENAVALIRGQAFADIIGGLPGNRQTMYTWACSNKETTAYVNGHVLGNTLEINSPRNIPANTNIYIRAMAYVYISPNAYRWGWAVSTSPINYIAGIDVKEYILATRGGQGYTVPTTEASYGDLIAYRDDDFVYLRTSFYDEGDGPVANLGYYGNYCKLPLSLFYRENPVPDPSVKYRVRPSWKSLIDPNDGGGESGSGGGNGLHNDSSDRIDISPMPTISAAEAGVITIFRPSLTQLQGLNNYLWTNVTDFIENVQKFFSNPIDYIIAFNIFPINPNVKAERNIKLGLWETTVKMPPVTTQWYGESCGKIFIPEYWGSALDYAPYTKISCMLPFIGSVQLNTDEVMGKELEIIYRFDLLSGSCVAFILVNNSVYYQFTGECAVSIPLTGADWSRVYSAAIGAIGTALSGGLSAGASGAIAQAGFQSSNMLAAKQGIQAAKQFEKLRDSMPKGTRGRPALLDAAKSARETAINAANSGNVGNAIRASRIISTVNNSVGSVMNGKISIQHSGTISGTSGLLGMRRPFVTIEYPNQSLAENYKHFVGYPSNIFAKLSDVSGYTECEQVIVENFPGTDNEYAEMLEALKGGVYL